MFSRRNVELYYLYELYCSFEAVKPLGHVEIVPSPYVTESTRVALLLPTFVHRIKESMDFIYHYEKTCMEHQDNTFLMLVFKKKPLIFVFCTKAHRMFSGYKIYPGFNFLTPRKKKCTVYFSNQNCSVPLKIKFRVEKISFLSSLWDL